MASDTTCLPEAGTAAAAGGAAAAEAKQQQPPGSRHSRSSSSRTHATTTPPLLLLLLLLLALPAWTARLRLQTRPRLDAASAGRGLCCPFCLALAAAPPQTKRPRLPPPHIRTQADVQLLPFPPSHPCRTGCLPHATPLRCPAAPARRCRPACHRPQPAPPCPCPPTLTCCLMGVLIRTSSRFGGLL